MTAMDPGARGWLVTVASDHYWRVAEWYELEDLINDGYVCWYRVVKKYETDTGRERSRGHLMRLFKRTYLNHIHDLSKACTLARIEGKVDDMVKTDSPWGDAWDLLGCSRNIDEFGAVVAEAPRVLQPLLRVLFSGSADQRLRSAYRVGCDGTRETLNSRLCRIAGVDPDQQDLAGLLRSFLSE